MNCRRDDCWTRGCVGQKQCADAESSGGDTHDGDRVCEVGTDRSFGAVAGWLTRFHRRADLGIVYGTVKFGRPNR